jgi:hypothetical protein
MSAAQQLLAFPTDVYRFPSRTGSQEQAAQVGARYAHTDFVLAAFIDLPGGRDSHSSFGHSLKSNKGQSNPEMAIGPVKQGNLTRDRQGCLIAVDRLAPEVDSVVGVTNELMEARLFRC